MISNELREKKKASIFTGLIGAYYHIIISVNLLWSMDMWKYC